MEESEKQPGRAADPRKMTAAEAEAKRYLSRSLLQKMHLEPLGDPVAYAENADGSRQYYYEPSRVREAAPESWYLPMQKKPTETMRLKSGTEIPRMSTKNAAVYGYYTKERLAQMHYEVVEEPVAYTTRFDRTTVYFYDKKTAIRLPLPCVACGKDVRYRRKLCRACFEADLAVRRAVGDAYRNQPYHMKREKVLFFDLELTGVYDHDEILSVSIIDGNYKVLMDTLVRPVHNRKWKRTEKIHGITPEMVEHAPTLEDLTPAIKELFAGCENLIAYGITTDYTHIRKIYDSEKERRALRAKTRDAAIEYTRYIAEHYPDLTHTSLTDAMETLGLSWEGVAHTSIADTIGCAKVWEALFPHYYEEEKEALP